MLFWIFFILIAACMLLKLGLELLIWAWIKKHRGSVPAEFEGHVDGEKAAKIEAYTQAKIVLGLIGDSLGKVLMLSLLLLVIRINARRYDHVRSRNHHQGEQSTES